MNQIARARQLAGLTARELATLAGTSHSTLIAYEQGHKVPRSDTRDRILRAAGWVVDAPAVRRIRHDARGTPRGVELVDVLDLADAQLRAPGRAELVAGIGRTLDAPIFPKRLAP